MTMIDLHLGRLWAGTEDSLHRLLSAEMPEGKQAFFYDEDEDRETPSRLVQREGNVGVLHVNGPLVNTDSWLNEFIGLTSYNDIRKGLVELAQDESVDVILMSMDTPGGAVSGMSDIADLVIQVDRNIKPVMAHTSSLMASAGYFIGSCARRVTAGRLADVGSIGVLQIHREASKLEEKMGVTTTVIRSGEYKALGNPYEPLSDKAKQTIQESCDYTYDLFVRHVADARGVSPEAARMQMAEGKVFTGEQAKAVNLVDDISTFDQALQYAANFVDNQLHFSENKSQYGSDIQGHPSMKKATLNPIVAAAQAMASQNQGDQEAAKPTPDAEVVLENQEQGAEAVEQGAQEATVETTAEAAQPSAVSVLQAQLAAAQEQLMDAKIELREANKALEAAAETAKGMRAVVGQSVQYLQVALGQAAGDVSALSDAQLLAEQARLQGQFDANFKAGGVASVSVETDDERAEKVSHARISRVKAASLSKRK